MKVAFLGDIAFIGKYDLIQNKKVKEKLKTLSDKLKDYDYVIANLESPLTEATKTLVCKSMHLRSSIKNVELLEYLNIDAVSLANNHVYDFGMFGLDDTIKILDKNNIDWFGVEKKDVTKKIKGEKFSLSGFNCYSTNGSGYRKRNKFKGVNPLVYEDIIEQLEKDKKNEAFSIMSLHWGDEHTNYPRIEHIELAKKIVAKKDVIIHGHHPHVIQGVQKHENSVVAYSLGNFLFDDCVSLNGKFVLKQTEENKKAFILEVEIENGIIINISNIGFKETDEGFEFFDIDDKIMEISKRLDDIISIEEYEKLRLDQINKVRAKKFGKRNFNWLISRLNYYSIGARISSEFRKLKYKKVAKNFR